jgi:hypothetical protein
MYPFNTAGGQIDSLFSVGLTTGLGGIILLKCTSPPTEVTPNEISEAKLQTIKRSQDDIFYEADPVKVRQIFQTETSEPFRLEWWMVIPVVAVVGILFISFVMFTPMNSKGFKVPSRLRRNARRAVGVPS